MKVMRARVDIDGKRFAAERAMPEWEDTEAIHEYTKRQLRRQLGDALMERLDVRWDEWDERDYSEEEIAILRSGGTSMGADHP